jgi:sRNA-binding protein
MSASPRQPIDLDACAAQLRERFPALFSGGAPKPLKLHIQVDIQEHAPGVFTKRALSAFLRHHTGSTAYLVALSKATHRFDLDGAPSTPVSDEHRAAALAELGRRRALRDERLRNEDEQRRNRARLLRDYEATTLTPANFCALKGIAPQALDALLALARREEEHSRAQRGDPPQRPAVRKTR